MTLTPAAAVKRVAETSELAGYEAVLASGPAALPAILKTLGARRAVPAMTALLSMIELPDPVETLGPLVTRMDGSVGAAALAMLARLRDPRVLPLIVERFPRRNAYQALGDHGDPKQVGVLRKVAMPIVGKTGEKLPKGIAWLKCFEDEIGDLDLALIVAVAMAKLGDQSLAPLVCQLATSVDHDDPDAGADLRSSAAIALSYFAAPGVAAAVRQTLRDPKAEVVEEGLRTSLYIGRVKEAESFMEVIRANGEQAGIAIWYLEAWAGSRPGARRDKRVSEAELDKWWAGAKAKFSADVCYRSGKPIDLGNLSAKLAEDPLHVRDQLRIHTGAACFREDLGGDPVTKLEKSEVSAWWKEHAGEFPPGKLHRWGRTFEPGAVD